MRPLKKCPRLKNNFVKNKFVFISFGVQNSEEMGPKVNVFSTNLVAECIFVCLQLVHYLRLE